jgi:phosphoglycolate phosphatase-like HAD superfamily hydrolase
MPLDPTRVQALCFDVDGTLSNTDDQYVHRLASWLHPLRFAFPRREVLTFARWAVMATETPGNLLMGLPDRLHLDGLLSRLGDWVYERGLERAHQPFILIEGVQEMLQELHRHFPMAVITARGARTTRRFLNQFSLTGLFDPIVSALTCPHTKPYPDPVLHAARQMGVTPENCLMIGDTTVDMRAGRAAGAQTVGVLCGFGQEDELRQAGADIILSTTSDLIPVLAGDAHVKSR